MYIQGHWQYRHHLDKYGHPSRHGAKDLMVEWKAERFDPESLMRFYKKAGAKYFAFMVNHCDNFDSWDSKYQPWNSVNIGPKKDLCRMWADAARKEGLRFGVTVHNTPYRCWNNFMPAWYGSDPEGPKAGVPYDGAVVTKADGKGTAWEGLDPRDLYGPVHKENEPCPEFVQQFLLRVDDLIQKYHPDLLYFDDGIYHLRDKVDEIRLNALMGMPDLVTQVAAHYYNSGLQWNDGRMEVVLNIKGVADKELTREMLSGAVVNDFEWIDPEKPFEHPWQTDTSLGNWHYLENDNYRSTEEIVRVLANIVANNGNMLLNVAPRGDGTIDEQQKKIVQGIGDWLDVNGDAIFATRPWVRNQEGDIRFTRSQKGDVLYAISLAWPADGKLTIKSLARGQEAVAGVSLLGHSGQLNWQQTGQGLTIDLPPEKPCQHAYSFRIAFQE
jgi:alpha-L-fucosidase